MNQLKAQKRLKKTLSYLFLRGQGIRNEEERVNEGGD